MPPSHFMIKALEYLAEPDSSSHRAASEHEGPRSAAAAPTATGRSRSGWRPARPVVAIAIALLVAALVDHRREGRPRPDVGVPASHIGGIDGPRR